MKIIVTAAILSTVLTLSTRASAQNTEERFQDLFLTAGYATAFGAALGTAFLAWQDDPSSHLKYVAMGASLGFLGGSLLGSYVIFSPMLTDETHPTEGTLLAGGALPRHGVVVRPVFNTEKHSLVGVEGGMTLVNF